MTQDAHTPRRTKRKPSGRLLRDPTGMQAVSTWTDPSGGTWQVRLLWAEVDGRAVPVGIDVRSVDVDDEGHWRSLTEQPPAQMRSAVLRALPVAQIADGQRRFEDAFYAAVGLSEPLRGAVERDRAVRDAPKPKRGRPFALTDEQYREVARLYEVAEAEGARSPARRVEQALTGVAGYGLDPHPKHAAAQSARVRKWIAEARRREYLPPPLTAPTRRSK